MNKVFEKIIDELKQESIIVDDDAGHRAVEIIEQIAEEYNNGWIPCSEKLPKENGHYLIFDNKGMIYESTYFANMWLIAASTIIAWQPLPEPFKERE